MSHRDYVRERGQREPRFAVERQAMDAELALGEAIVRRREERAISVAELADVTGIPAERLEAIEEGDTLTLHEMLWLLHALELSVILGPDFQLATKALRHPKPVTLMSG